MQEKSLYRSYSQYLKETYGEKVYKIPIHLPASCPNRDGTIGVTGCSFCGDEAGGFESLPASLSVKSQLSQNMAYMGRRYGAKKFIAYFQNFSNTYLPTVNFRQSMLDSVEANVVGLAVSTRPDCLPESCLEITAEIQSQEKMTVTYELGLQTANYHTLLDINRGHGLAEFINAVQVLKKYGFGVCAHVILNLPGDKMIDVVETARVLTALRIDQVKIHALYIMRKTTMGKWYMDGRISLISRDEYEERVIQFLENLDPGIVIQRLVGRAPEEDSLFVNWGTSWWKIRESIHEKMRRGKRYQGSKSQFPQHRVRE